MDQGFLVHSSTFKLGRPLLTEVFYLQPRTVLGDIRAPTLTVEHRLIGVDGAQHGFAVHDDPHYANPQSQQ